ncbi:MAG TPA: GDSL-type esterase/lipase family protein [Bryobacteraceae bacterium]|nr:GDSL-type esterase/lipase family protein [Bryobacteraceae bacterium]
MRSFPLSTALVIAALGLLLAGARAVRPAVKAPELSEVTALVDFDPALVPFSPMVRHTEPEPPTIARPALASPLLDDSDGSLDHFYASLWRTEKGGPGAVTRIVHYGDSPTTADLITGDIRALLQQRFGSAGHGYVLIGKPWAWYGHNGVELSSDGWDIAPATQFKTHDGLFGLGGVSFTGETGAESHIVFKDHRHTSFEVWFLMQPAGGVFSVSADGVQLGRVNTAGLSKVAARAGFSVAHGASRLDLRVEQGSVRLFGLSVEKSGPGVVYDSLGLNGASITVLSRMFNAGHWAAELRERDPQLVVINYGTNEADFTAFIDRQYEGELREAIRRIRAALPAASILVMSPMDRGYRADSGQIETMPNIPRIVDIQQRVARQTGCGFFNTYEAMGGEGTIARWYAAQPRLVAGDFIHPTPGGGKLVATIFAREIGFGLNRYKLRQMLQTTARAAVR